MALNWPRPILEVDESQTFYQLIGKLRGQFAKVFEHAWEHPDATAPASYLTELLSQTSPVINILAKQKVADDKEKLEKEQQRLERDEQLLVEKALWRTANVSARQSNDHSGPDANLVGISTASTPKSVEDNKKETSASTMDLDVSGNGENPSSGNGQSHSNGNDTGSVNSARDRFQANSWPNMENQIDQPTQATQSIQPRLRRMTLKFLLFCQRGRHTLSHRRHLA